MASVKKAIKIFARLKPTDASTCQYEVDKHINDDGSTDDVLILNSSAEDYYSNNNVALNRPDAYKFRFTKVFEGHSSQDELFEEMCQPVLESALQGYNSTIFAYGQTGSGKTYTMTGSRQQWRNRGIIPRSLSYIFQKFNEMTDQGYISSAFLSYLEIYNENGYDLLHTGFSSGRIEDLKKVQLLEDSQQQIHMKNLTVHPIKSEDEAMQLLYLGDHNRIIAETPMNEASTRSHCIFTIHLNVRQGNSSTVRRSKVHLVDLAGSERLANSNSTGQLFHEARHINLALHYLEQVIVALGDSNRTHIPYRNSMMTSILRDSLGGNCMTSMVATLSLENRNIMETLSTCRFSQRVALVTNAAMLNEETDPMLMIAQLKHENKRLKDIIANSSIKNSDTSSGPLSQEEVADCWKLVEKFISDSDEEAILPIPPDMRMVQTCFRCLKMAVQMNKEDLASISPDLVHNQAATDYHEKSQGTPYNENMTRDQLLECLRIRDAEIQVLSKMLRPSQSHTKKSLQMPSMVHSASSINIGSVSGANLHEHGDGPQQHSATLNSDFEDPDDSPGRTPNASAFQKLTINHTYQKDPETSHFNHVTPSDEYSNLFDSIFIEGLSDSKKRALDSYVKSYKGFDKLKNVQENLSAKKSEVESIENLLRRNHANLNNLKVVMLSSEGGAEEEDLFMKEAVESQTLSIQKQERQLHKCREEMRQIEENLKGLYAALMCDFEKHWHTMKEFKMRSGIPAEIDFTEMVPPQHQVQQEETTEKPVAEVTKGIVKGVGQISPSSQQNAKRSKSTVIKAHSPTEFYISTAPQSTNTYQRAHQSKSCNSPGKSGRRSSANSAKGKSPQNSPREMGMTGGGRSPRKSHSKIMKAPPVTPAATLVHSQTPLQLLHHHQHHDFPSERSTDNLMGYYSPPQNYNNIVQPNNYNNTNNYGQSTINASQNPNHSVGGQYVNSLDDKEDEEELLKDLPMTGDATIDQEILAFFKTRQAVFKRINNDKTGKFGGTDDNQGSVGGMPPSQAPFYSQHQQPQQTLYRGEASLF